MTTFYVTNAFSINMLERAGYNIALRPINIEGVKNLLANETWKSLVGHPDTASVMSNLLGVQIQTNRESVKFSEGWSMIVGQYTGPRLPEGAISLPEGATIEFWQVYPL